MWPTRCIFFCGRAVSGVPELADMLATNGDIGRAGAWFEPARERMAAAEAGGFDNWAGYLAHVLHEQTGLEVLRLRYSGIYPLTVGIF